MREKLQRFMTGRYGADQLARAISLAALVCIVISMLGARSPFFAFLLGIGPQLPQIVPAIAAGNLVFVLLLGLLAGGGEVPLWRRGIAWLAAAAGKFAALYLLVVKLLCAILPLKEPQVAMFTAMFSYPQLVTALAGGGIALLLTPLIRRAVRR